MADASWETKLPQFTNDPWRIRTLPIKPFTLDLNDLAVLWGTAIIGQGKPSDRVPAIERPPFVHTAPRGQPVLRATTGGAAVTEIDLNQAGGKNWILSHWAMWSTEGAAIAAAVCVSDGTDFIPVWTGTLAATATTKETAQVGTFNPPMKVWYPAFVRFYANVSAGKTLTVRAWYYEVDEE